MTEAALRAADRQAIALIRARRLHEALALYERLVAVAPQTPWLLVQQGAALLLGTDSARALAHFEMLTRSFPRLEGAWQGLGKALLDQHRCADAAAAFTEAARVAADPAQALYHRGMARLLAGDFVGGWRDYEHRLRVPGLRGRDFDQPRWDGAALAGRRLLVVCEQGYGDVFQFVRYLRCLRDCGGTVVFECPGELRAVLADATEGVEVVPLRGRQAPDTVFDVHVALMSLPLLLGTTLEAVPWQGPYLSAAAYSDRWDAAGLQVGVCWAGNPGHPQDAHRSFAPELLAPLAAVPGVRLVSLQKDRAAWPPLPGLDGFLHPPPLPLNDFAATARVLMGLDLVITVDTSVAHLAGALGRPVWLLVSWAGEWRWLLERTDSPWYPTMRIFRQPRLGDWGTVIAEVRQALEARCDGSGGRI